MPITPCARACPWPEPARTGVRSNGEIRWGGEMIFLSEALIGEPVGIAETEAGDWLVRFADMDLGIIDRRSKKLRRFTAARPPRHPETPGPAAGPLTSIEQTEKTVNHVSGL
jgi:hypothetical protein